MARKPFLSQSAEKAKEFEMSSPTRFLSVDRFADKYPSMTPYHYTLNNPVRFIDINGDSVWIEYQDNDGNNQHMLYTRNEL